LGFKKKECSCCFSQLSPKHTQRPIWPFPIPTRQLPTPNQPLTARRLQTRSHGHTKRGSERKCAESRKQHQPLGNPSAAGCRQRRATPALRGCAGTPLPHPSGHHGSPTASSAPLPSAASARQRVAGARPPAVSSSSPQVRSIQAYPTLKSWVRHWVDSVFCLHI